MTRKLWLVSCCLLAIPVAVVRADDARRTEVPPAPQRWAEGGSGGEPGYLRHIEPLLGKAGCSNRACHGSFQGQGGFRLSLFSSDPKMDFENMVKSGRVDPKDADGSLAVLKGTEQVKHKGGKRIEPGSWQHRMFLTWIRAGANFTPGKEPVLERIVVEPNQIVASKRGEKTQLKVTAYYADNTREDVTGLTIFSTNDELIAAVNEAGQITTGNHGDTAVVATFGGAVVTSHVIVPFPTAGKPIHFPPNNKLDELVVEKWKKLGLQPSDLADDGEFLRRVSLDLIGTLPTSDEARKFLADTDPQKRAKKIDELLNRSEYALYWATKFSDLTGNDDRFTPLPRPKTAWLWYDWLQDKLQKNVPYDELVAGVVTATSREGRSAEEYAQEYKAVAEAITKGDYHPTAYAQRKTNDIFWKKSGNRGDQVAMQIAYAFLGVRLECAQCHKHPFDRWTQDDFKSYTAFFNNVRVGVPSDAVKEMVAMNQGNRQGFQYQEVFTAGAPGKPAPKGRPAPGAGGIKPRPLGGSEYPLEAGTDPRVALMKWMRASDNPFFAKAIVNRIWAHYFGAGIVDPPDDHNAANPPSNPALLDWLAKDFIEHQFDLKHLHRRILNSRVYQLTWKPNETNALDRRNFAHALLRRVGAEVLVDAIDQVTGATERYSPNFAPAGTRAIALAPTRLGNQGPGYALSIFGRPLRSQTCDCERSSDAGLPQAMYLLNDVDVNGKISAPKGRLAQLLAQIGDNDQLIDELYLGTVSRYPTADEKQRARDHVAKAADRKAGFEDLMWSLINLREFVFNH